MLFALSTLDVSAIAEGLGNATSVHVYAPPLRSMSFYRFDDDEGLVVDRVEEAATVDLCNRSSARRGSLPDPERPARRSRALKAAGALFVDTRRREQRDEFGVPKLDRDRPQRPRVAARPDEREPRSDGRRHADRSSSTASRGTPRSWRSPSSTRSECPRCTTSAGGFEAWAAAGLPIVR